MKKQVKNSKFKSDFVIPAKAGIQTKITKLKLWIIDWIPSYEGMTIFSFLLVFLTFNFLLLTFYPVNAVSMNSSAFKIESASINDAAGNKSSASYKLSDTLGQLAAGQFSSNGYIIKAGFQYLHSIFPFSFAISNIRIDFGEMVSDVSKTNTTNLTVSFGGAGQYQVTAEELGPLTKIGGSSTIPNTSCDGGVSTCTLSTSKPWTLSSAYGFGYNMSGQDFPADFTNSTYYRPFPNRLLSESPTVVMSNASIGKNRQSTVTFKLNISGVQAAGTYQAVINFVATPSY